MLEIATFIINFHFCLPLLTLCGIPIGGIFRIVGAFAAMIVPVVPNRDLLDPKFQSYKLSLKSGIVIKAVEYEGLTVLLLLFCRH